MLSLCLTPCLPQAGGWLMGLHRKVSWAPQPAHPEGQVNRSLCPLLVSEVPHLKMNCCSHCHPLLLPLPSVLVIGLGNLAALPWLHSISSKITFNNPLFFIC